MKTRTQIEHAVADLKRLENAWRTEAATFRPNGYERCIHIAREFEVTRHTLEWVLETVRGPADDSLPPYAAETRP